MKPIFVFRHVPSEGPAYFGDFLSRQQIPFRIFHLDEGDMVPDTADEAAALVFMGGPMSVNDDLPWIGPELRLIRQAQEQGIPLLGHCLGGQLIAKALGAEVGPNPVPEYGWLPVEQQANAAARDWLAGLPDSFDVFHWHGETFTIPAGATPILAGTHCANQAFVLGNTLAMQCHVEMTAPLVIEWAELHADEIAVASDTIQTYDQLTAELDNKITALQARADRLYQRWLQPLHNG